MFARYVARGSVTGYRGGRHRQVLRIKTCVLEGRLVRSSLRVMYLARYIAQYVHHIPDLSYTQPGQNECQKTKMWMVCTLQKRAAMSDGDDCSEEGPKKATPRCELK